MVWGRCAGTSLAWTQQWKDREGEGAGLPPGETELSAGPLAWLVWMHYNLEDMLWELGLLIKEQEKDLEVVMEEWESEGPSSCAEWMLHMKVVEGAACWWPPP